MTRLEETQTALKKAGAEIIAPITEGPTGWNIFSRNPDDVADFTVGLAQIARLLGA